jgi:phosphoglycolate phosphatase
MSLVFDFDGVIVDTRDDNIKAINKLSKKYGFEPMTVESYTAMLGYNFTHYWEMLLGKACKSFMRDLHAVPRPHPRINPGVKEMLLNFRPAIVSSNSGSLIREVLKKEGIELPIYGVEYNPSKIEKLGKLRGEHNVFVTDTAGDVLEGKKAGYFVIAVTWGFTDEKSLAKVQPHAIVRAPEELRQILEQELKTPLLTKQVEQPTAD